MKQHAQQFIDNELSVTPVIDKKAFLSAWQTIHGEQILAPKYDSQWAKANGLGLLLGKTSGVICLDIDILDDNEELKDIRKQLLDMLPPLYSGRNGHPQKPTARFFKYNGESNKKFNSISVEILSTGNQVVLPPSQHPLGVLYSWVGNKLHEIDIDDLPDLPEEICVQLRTWNNARKKQPGGSTLQPMPGRCQSGSHNYLSSIGVAMRCAGESPQDIIRRLIAVDQEINGKQDFLYFLCKTRPWRTISIDDNAKAFVDEICMRNKVDPVNEKYKTLKSGFYFIEEPAAEGAKPKKIPDYHGLAKYVREHLYLKTKEKGAFIFNGECYEPIDKTGIEKKIYEATKKKVSPHHLGNFSKLAKVESYYHPDFINPPGQLNLGNGILNTETMELSPPDKDKFFTYKIKHSYIGPSNTPIFDKFLELISTGEADKQQAIVEFMGYIISGCDYNQFNKVLILDGGGANGKTTLIKVIQNVIGMENTSAESLVSLKDNRFSVDSLVGKLANFCSEEPKSAFSATGMLKKLTGGDPVMVEPKHMKSFSYINYAKFIISYNEMPFLPDTTAGMERRLMIVPCVTDLEKNPQLKIKNIFEQMKPEYGAIIHRCMMAFKEVQKRGEFTQVESGKERFKELVLKSDPFLDFVDQRVRAWEVLSEEDRQTVRSFNQDPFFDPSITTETLWEEFQKFVGPKHNYRRRSFDTRVGNHFKKFNSVKKTSTRPRGWEGVVLVSE